MSFLARKITRPKWDSSPGMDQGAVGADAVTADLRTQNNALSLWEFSDAEKELREIVLALAANFDRIEKIDIAWFLREDAEKAGIEIQPTKGQTPVDDLRDWHRDAMNLDLDRLGGVARSLSRSVRNNGWVRRFRKKEVRNVLKEAVDQRRLIAGSLSEGIQRDLRS